MPITSARIVILEILRSAEDELTGKTRLHKAFYFAHLYYAGEKPGVLTNHPIARLTNGPAIHRGEDLIAELVRDGLITVDPIHEGPYPEQRYRLTELGKSAERPSVEACFAIERATRFCQSKTAAELSELTHEHSRSWREGKDGDLLEIYVDLIPDEEFYSRKEDVLQLQQQLFTDGQ